jgi:UDP-glucose 4-epimerase
MFAMADNFILITGGAGFIGSHTVDLLIEKGLGVIVVDRVKPQFPNSKAIYYQIDINSEAFEDVFKKHNIVKIIHLAAQPSVSYSVANPVDDATDNVLASIRVIEMAKKYKAEKIIVSSSAALYAHPQYFPIDEKHPTEYMSPYGISKHAMEEYLKISGINYIIFRFANVYGPRQNSLGEAGVVAIFTDNMVQNKPVVIHGDGEQIRDFVFVKDVANALYLGVISDISGETINVSTCYDTTINQLYKALQDATHYQQNVEHVSMRHGDIRKSILDNSKAKELLNWQPSVDLTNGIEQTVKFFEFKEAI